jgi:hypothetical protein
MCPIPTNFRYLVRNIFLPSYHNAPLCEACESVILEDGMTGQNYLEFLQNELPELEDVPLVIPDM